MQQMTRHSAPVISPRVPQPGDVLASRCSARSDIYAISVIPGPTQVVGGVYDQAVETARRFAPPPGHGGSESSGCGAETTGGAGQAITPMTTPTNAASAAVVAGREAVNLRGGRFRHVCDDQDTPCDCRTGTRSPYR